MKVLLFRHGTVQDNGEKLFLGRTDLPLSLDGCLQATAWKTHLQKQPQQSIVTSPLTRTLEFARILAGNRSADITLCDAFSEINLGDWDGRPMREIRETDPAAWRNRGEDLARFRPPGGESFEDVQKRVIPAFEKLTDSHDPELIVVSHAGVNRVLLCHLLGMPLAHLFRIGQDYACLNILECGHGRTRVSRINVPSPVGELDTV